MSVSLRQPNAVFARNTLFCLVIVPLAIPAVSTLAAPGVSGAFTEFSLPHPGNTLAFLSFK